MNRKLLLFLFWCFCVKSFAQTIPPGNDFGYTQGAFQATDGGAATYSIPFVTPAGTGGLQPKIGLSYSNQAGNSFVGMGWSLTGFSSITRSNKTRAQDEVATTTQNTKSVDMGINYDRTDRFSLDGERLVLAPESINTTLPFDDNYGNDQTVYYTEQHNFSKVILTQNTTTQSPQYFEVFTKSGLILEYGNTTDSRVMNGNLTQNVAIQWLVNKIQDRKGNYMTFSYTQNPTTGEVYPDEINYTGNVAGNLSPYNKIKFIYETRPDPTTVYGIRYQNANRYTQRLQSVRVLYQNTLIREYKLTYNFNQFSLLKQVQECDGSNPQISLEPTTFEWSNVEVPISSPIQIPAMPGTNEGRIFGDFNGDGLQDIAVWDFKTTNLPFTLDVSFYLNNGSGVFNLSGSSNISTIVTSDAFASFSVRKGEFNGDNISDLVATWNPNGATANNSFFILSNPPASTAAAYTYPCVFYVKQGRVPSGSLADDLLVDINRDGILDFVDISIPATGPVLNQIYIARKLPTNDATPQPYYAAVNNADLNASGYTNSWPPGSVLEQLYEDIDNDGLTDIFIYDKNTGENVIIFPTTERTNSVDAQRIVQFQTRITSGNRTWLQNSWLAGVNNKVGLADMNGDNLPDILVVKPSNNQVSIIQNKGIGGVIFETNSSIHKNFTATWLSNYSNVTVSDINSDGLLDLTFFRTTDGENRSVINKGDFNFDFNSGPELSNALPVERFKDVGTNPPAMIGSFLEESHADLYYYNTTEQKHFVRKLKQNQGFTIKKFKNGAGLENIVQYKSLLDKSLYEKAGDVTFPNIDFQSPIYVVSKVVIKSSTEEIAKKYRYFGAKINVEGRGFRGFSRVIETDSITGIYDIRYYVQGENQWQFTGNSLVKTERYFPNTLLIAKAEHTAQVKGYPGAYPTAFHSFDAQEVSYDYQNNKSQRIRKEVDNYGNATLVVVNYGDGLRDSTVSNYTDNVPNWILGRLTLAKVFRFAPNQTTIERQALFSYDATGYLNQEVTDLNLTPQLRTTKTYTYDVFGNITQSTTNAWNGTVYENRTNQTVYDSPTKRFVVQATNAKGHQSSATHDLRFGVPLTETDVNGLITTYEYDGYSRLTKQTFPDGTWRSVFYRKASSSLFASPTNAVFLTYTQSSAGQIMVEHYDAFNRGIQSKSKGFDGRWVLSDHIFGRTTSPALLETVRDTYPYFEGETSQGFSERQLDILGRVAAICESKTGGVRKANLQYGGSLTEVFNYKNQKQRTLEDSKGRNIESTWNDGKKLLYAYDAADRILTVKDFKGNTITNQYDTRGYKIQTDDPDMGRYQYEYNGFGELLLQRYPDDKTVKFTYDILGRVLTRTEDEGVTTYTYDTGNKAVGKLISVNSSNVVQSITYDNLGRKSQETTQLPSLSKTYTSTFTYDNQSRLLTIAYPASSLLLKHVYNTQGFLSELRNNANDNLFWRAKTADASGAIVEQEFGNGVQTTQQFEATTRYLKSILTTKGATAIQDLQYDFDDLGHLTTRRDLKRNNEESFAYDDVNRLVETRINSQIKTTLTYDDLGNIITKSDVGTYEYDPNAPHRLVNVRTNNANVQCSFTLNINTLYTSFSKVKEISNDTAKVEVLYGADQQRIIQRMYVKGSLTRTKIYLGLSEVEIFSTGLTRTTAYIGGVAIQENETQGTTTTSRLKYVLKDHLGSINGFTNEAGVAIEEVSFDAWGLRRNIDWAVATNPTGSNYERGFTNHEHYDLFSIIDMNGRIYDPVLGRFLQPDPFVQDADNLQAYNRYAYVLNNPLSYTDPSGYFLKKLWKGVTNVFKGAVDFVKENWKPLVTIAVVIAVSYLTAGLATPFLGALGGTIAGGFAGGFAGGLTGTLFNGGNFSDALKAGFRGAVIGGITAGLTYGVGSFAKSFLGSNAFADAGFAAQRNYIGIKVLGHGLVQGTMAEINGGRFEHGFIVGAIAGGTEDFISSQFPTDFGKITAAAIVGGTSSELTGGSFVNGAITGAFVMMFNQLATAEAEKEFRAGMNKYVRNEVSKLGKSVVGSFKSGYGIGESINKGNYGVAFGRTIVTGIGIITVEAGVGVIILGYNDRFFDLIENPMMINNQFNQQRQQYQQYLDSLPKEYPRNPNVSWGSFGTKF